jgi:hypothetical protein
MKTYVHVWQYLAEFFLQWEMFQKISTENQNTHFMFNKLKKKSCRL